MNLCKKCGKDIPASGKRGRPFQLCLECRPQGWRNDPISDGQIAKIEGLIRKGKINTLTLNDSLNLLTKGEAKDLISQAIEAEGEALMQKVDELPEAWKPSPDSHPQAPHYAPERSEEQASAIDFPPKDLPKPSTTPAPVQKPSTIPTPVQSTPNSLDDMIRGIALAAAQDALSRQDATEIVDAAVEKFEARIRQVEERQPQVIHVHVPGKPEVIEIEGRQHEAFSRVLECVGLELNVMLVGPAGSGKTTIARNVAHALGIACHTFSVNDQTSDVKLFGYKDAVGNYHRTPLREAWEHGGLLLLDEVDNGRANLLSALNLMLSSDEMSWPDETVKRHENFRVMCGANTFGQGANREYSGRNVLDGAFLDRFVLLEIGYDVGLETELVSGVLTDVGECLGWMEIVHQVRKNINRHGLKVIVSPRAAIDGAKLLAAGWELKDVLDVRVVRGLSKDQSSKVLEGVKL